MFQQRLEVIEQPSDRNQPAVILEALPKKQVEETGSNGNGNGHHKPCGNCGGRQSQQHQQVEEAAPETQQGPPQYLMDLYNRYHLVGWMEENLLKTHQAVRESEDADHASLVVKSSLEAFLDVVEDVMFRCDDLARLEEVEERAKCPIAGVWDELETKMVFYGKELRFLGTMEGVSHGA